MLIEHRGKRPNIDPSAWIAPNAVISGDVTIGPSSRVLFGAVLTSEGAELRIGSECVIMEQAVLRAAGQFPLRLGDHVLVGPHAYLTGCSVGSRSFIATGTMIFNGATLGEACTVSLGAKVHVDADLPEDTQVPMGFIAFGRPARIYPPDQSPQVHEAMSNLSFPRYVFSVETEGRTRAEVMDEILSAYTRSLTKHAIDTILDP